MQYKWIKLGLVGLFTILVTSGCNVGSLFVRPTPTPPPTRVSAPTFTPTPDFIQGLIVVTPPNAGTPGVIVIPPGVDPRSVIPVPESPTPTVTQTATPLPPSATPTSSSTPMPGAPTDASTSPVIPTATFPAGALPQSPIGTPTPTPVGGLVPPPSATPTPTDTSTPLIPTDTPSPTITPTPTPSPTPYIIVASGLVNLRTGPSLAYPLVAQLGPNIPVAIVGQNPEGTWYQICCVNGDSVWVAKEHVTIVNDVTKVALTLSGPPPTPTPTGTVTPTPTITPTPTSTPYPFQVLEGPLYFPTNNEMLTIWAKIADPGGNPLPGYFVQVEFRNSADGSTFEDRQNTKGEAASTDTFEYNVPPGPASGNRVQYNYKFEFLPPDPKAEDPNSTQTRLSFIDGYWQIYVTNGSGTQLSDTIQFDTRAGNTNREVYVAWILAR